MKFTITIFLLSFCFCAFGQNCDSYGDAQIDLNVNNISARLLNSGDLWWDGNEGKYITPADGMLNVSAIFAGALWIGGLDPSNNIKLAGQTYRGSNGDTDYYPGPLNELGQTSLDDCSNWDRFWMVNKSEVDAHILDFNDGAIDQQIDNIYGWPGRNNPHFESIFNFPLPTGQKLAPFFDNDQDGDYNPDNGDYPLIKGDQSIWWVFNDNGGPHRVTFATPMQIEVHAMAYAYTNGNNEDLNNSTFYDFELINKASESLLDGYIGLWVDFDLGCYEDDYVGYDEEYQMMYVYNTDATDGSNGTQCSGGVNTYGDNIPMVGIKKIDGDINPVSSYVAQNNGATDPPVATTDPDTGNEFYNYLRGVWRDGTPMTFGGSGFNPTSTDTVKFIFNGDPSDEAGWSMCTANLPLGDRRSLMSSAMPDLSPGQSITASYAVIYVSDITYPCPSLDRLKDAADNVCNVVMTSSEAPISTANFTISPNPVMDIIKITSDNFIQSIKVLDLNGQAVIVDDGPRNKIKAFDISNLPPSIYLISITDDNGNVGIEKIVKN